MTGTDVTGASIQERLYPDATCFGCGLANPKGLHLRSYAQDDVVVATFMPWPEHDNGLGYLNGGIIATAPRLPQRVLLSSTRPIATDGRRFPGRRSPS